jgi:hypothetical protein
MCFNQQGQKTMLFVKVKSVPTKRALDAGDSAAFSGIFPTSGFFYISNIVHAHPSASNAHR